MKPLGTITMFFPFVDDETRETLELIMDSALDFYDFTCQLVDKVCTEEATEDLVHLASFHAFRLFDFKLLEKLAKTRHDTKVAEPYILLVGPFFYEEASGFGEAKKAIAEIIAENPDDWVEYRLHAQAYLIGNMTDPGGPYAQKTLDKMEQLIKDSKQLACFEAEFHHYRAWQVFEIDSDYAECVRILQKAYDLALEFDNQVLAARVLKDLAFDLYHFSSHAFFALLFRARNMAKELGLRGLVTGMLNDQGIIHEERGEFDAALECYLECMRLEESYRTPSMHVLPHNIAAIFNEMNKSEEALEWAKMALDTSRTQPKEIPASYFVMAESLAGIGRVEEAQEYLIEGQKRSSKYGKKDHVIRGHLTTGILEMAQGRPYDAMHSFEQALEISETTGKQASLLRLTDVELFLFESEGNSAEYSGPWMERLEREITEKDVPGVRGRLLLLKAELRLKQGRREAAELLIDEVRRIAKQPSTRFLETKIAELMRRGDQMMDA